MSTTVQRQVALDYASQAKSRASILLEFNMGMVGRGADLSWLSQYPHEKVHARFATRARPFATLARSPHASLAPRPFHARAQPLDLVLGCARCEQRCARQ
eukprot:3175713-Prymnesium_polylepis.1